jgi:dihydroxyacetone kinase-like protein
LTLDDIAKYSAFTENQCRNEEQVHTIKRMLEMKKLINNPETVIPDSLSGMAAAHPNLLKVHDEPRFIYRADAPVKGCTALISGGGSGHEPMHAGFVGMGMLHAACPGEVFTSPTPDQMLEAAKIVHSGNGVLFIVKNYSGDVMNFEMAVELAHQEGIPVSTVIIDDDVAVRDSLYTQGRRGVGTTVLVEKICGAASEKGYDLQSLTDLGLRVSRGGRSMGMALTSCTVPARGEPTFDIGPDEIEIGIGIHGEPGRARTELKTAEEITRILALSIIDDPVYTRTHRVWDPGAGSWIEKEISDQPFQKEDRVLAFVNSMGGTPLSELYIVYNTLVEICREKGLVIVGNLIGPYITSLEMQGCSITLLKMDDEMLELWDAPVHTPSLRRGI